MHSCFTPQVYFPYLKPCSSNAHPGQEQSGTRQRTRPVHVGIICAGTSAFAHCAGLGPAGRLPSLHWWRPLQRLVRLRERLTKDFIECQDREQRQKAEGDGCWCPACFLLIFLYLFIQPRALPMRQCCSQLKMNLPSAVKPF